MAEALGSPSVRDRDALALKICSFLIFFSIVPNHDLLSSFLVFRNDTRSLYFDTLSAFLQREQSLTLSFVTKISLVQKKKGLLIYDNKKDSGCSDIIISFLRMQICKYERESCLISEGSWNQSKNELSWALRKNSFDTSHG